ncbi:unnamed protein product [Ostreobium quekettii]|uniref:PX domain-containing protein n=1 Tax=Ostreobium quekettii TaxID=121088 RepID=A0A8S1J280_9CHLO|nr:unnamed protein product [Ostreobium quekettii]|eukprot:evm.model.scf_294.7 EVM.evm.TU.scf_294.7   scf_294:43627-48519(-)
MLRAGRSVLCSPRPLECPFLSSPDRRSERRDPIRQIAKEPGMDSDGPIALERRKAAASSLSPAQDCMGQDDPLGGPKVRRDNEGGPLAGPSSEGGATEARRGEAECGDPDCSSGGAGELLPEVGRTRTGEGPGAWFTYADAMIGPPRGDPIPTSPVISEITPAGDDDLQVNLDAHVPASASVHVVVTDARQVEETRLGVKSQFTTYCVKTATDLQSYSFTEQSVWRRFRDFEALHKVLHANHRGYFIPPLPDKNFIQAKMANADFVQMRKAELNCFLRGLVAHPFLYETEELRVFLGVPQDLCSSSEWQEVVQRAGARNLGRLSPRVDAGPTSTATELFEKMRRMGSPVKKESMKSKHGIPEDERQLRQESTKLKQLETFLSCTCEKARGMVQALEGELDAHLEMGAALVAFARYEDKVGAQCGQFTETGRHYATRAATLQKAGYASLKVHQVCQRFVTMTAGRLISLHEQLNLVPSGLLGLEDREHALDAVHRAEAVLERKRLRLEELRRDSAKKLGGAEASSKRFAELEFEIGSLERDVERLTGDYKVIKQRNQTELARCRETRHVALIGMARKVAQIQAEMNKSAAEAWRAMAEHLEKIMATSQK